MKEDVILANSATDLTEAARGRIVVSGSHGGAYPACLLARAGVRGGVLNDAGIGKDGAGRRALAILGELGIPAAVADHRSARIGDAADMLRRGVISAVNESAAAAGCAEGQSVEACVSRLVVAPWRDGAPPQCFERRLLVETRSDGTKVWVLDSASQVRAENEGAIIVTGSHGGLVGGSPAAALKTRALLAVFNDAGVGADRAGIGRLEALASRQIAAVTVAAASARIGDGLSTFKDGIVSFVNGPAELFGARPGQATREMILAFMNE